MTPLRNRSSIVISRGTATWSNGQRELAAAVFQRSLTIDERIEGPQSPYLVEQLAGLARVQCARGDLDAAIEQFARALALTQHNFELSAVERSRLVDDYASCLEKAGRIEDGRIVRKML